jgi:ferritin-like metal-binding protein YciE
MSDTEIRDQKLIQYLNEAYGKERQLELVLDAHVGMTSRASYKKRLREHLRETKRHAAEIERRVKQLGGRPESVPIGPDGLARGASVVADLASRTAVAVQAPIHAIRGTGEQEKMLKNAKREYADEHEEIATYTGIESLATSVGDSETAALARSIRRDEERMARFLERTIPSLARSVAQAEIPAQQRRTSRRRGATGSTRRTSASTNARRTTSNRRRTSSRRVAAVVGGKQARR